MCCWFFRETKNYSLHLFSTEYGNLNRFELIYNEEKVKPAEMSLDETGQHTLSHSIWNSHSRQTELRSTGLFFFLKIWKIMKYIGIWVCDMPGKKTFIKSDYHYLKDVCLGL